jgi:hypothetical protein
VTTTSPADIPAPTETIELPPSYAIPATLLLSALLLAWIQPWVGVVIGLFALFLGFQAATLRLRFTATALDVCRGETCIRHFPYQAWQNWQIFWGKLPILFYFREVESIHFLPILFSPKQLRACLEQRCPRIQSQNSI